MLLTFALPDAGRSESQLDEWAVEEGYGLDVDASGFALPTAIAFAPEPGPAPDDPLYFVTELGGEIKVVANDRTVTTFAHVPTRDLPREDLRQEGQTGLAGICTDAATGSLFVTYTYADEGGVLRNGMRRFDTGAPGTFAATPTGEQAFDAVFADAQSAPAHQIGHCAVDDGRVFVGIGDGGDVAAAGDRDMLLGKIACLTVDGQPCPDNPFLDDLGEPGPRDYVWAYGFRNPFGLTIADGVLFSAENGVRTDRILRVVQGEDHFWDGSGESISAAADVVLDNGPSPVQLDFVAADRPGLPDAGTFVFAVFHHSPHTGVMAFDYDFAHTRTRSAPRYLLQYTGDDDQRVIAAASGPDGIYTATALPDADGDSHVLRLSADSPTRHAPVIGATTGEPDPALGVLEAHSCVSCHSIDGEGEGIGPSLDRFGLRWRLTQRLNAPGYEAQLRALDELREEPFASYADARAEVLAADGVERTEVWLRHFLEEPRFDNPDAQMPNQNLGSDDVADLTHALSLVMEDREPGTTEQLISFARSHRREIGAGYVLGVLTVLGLGAVLRLGGSVRRRRRRDGLEG